MKELKAEFLRGAMNEIDFPNHEYPEIAFTGRSNVGKSSLLNSIVLRKNLARTSATPGKTREINFFLVEGKWVFVDLPGFGYAQVSKELRKKFETMNLQFLENRSHLKMTFILIDSRHDPMPIDLALIELHENKGRNYVILLTKCDKISKKSISDRISQIRNLTAECKFIIDVLPYSIVTGEGRKDLLGIIKRLF